jgi:NADH-quinone oxidoreductase subunit C
LVTVPEIFAKLSAALPERGLVLEEGAAEAAIRVPREALIETARRLQGESDLNFDALMCLSGVDRATELEVVYHLCSMRFRHRVTLRCVVAKDDPVIPSVCSIWPAADWHEREAWDLIGIRFAGHPDFRRILCPDDWEGHPLRKDYAMPVSYHGIPLTAELPSENLL